MIKQVDREILLDVLAGSAALLAFVASIEMGQLYHGMKGLRFDVLAPLTFLVVSLMVLGVLSRFTVALTGRISRIWMCLFLLVGFNLHFGAWGVQAWGATIVLLAFGLLFGLGLWASFKATFGVWAGLRRVVAFVPWLMVMAPVIAGYGMGSPVVWLDRATPQESVTSATVVLLLDELNAKSSAGLQKVLIDRGLHVKFKPVLPVHGSTTEVIPAVFTEQDFKGARPCGLTRVCANSNVLDFAKVSVKRNDVDVIGFHHPYCSIQGLRSCGWYKTYTSIWEEGRWEFALQRRFDVQWGRDQKSCQLLSHTSWSNMREKVIEGLMRAPALQMGGVVFAHVPLPHPPAAGTGSLGEQYAINLEQSEKLMDQILDRLVANKIEPRILIFSDHPLRPVMWCSNLAAQFDVPCKVTPELLDDHVPLIVAARSGLPAIDGVKSNQQVFNVLRDWLRH